MGQNSNFYQVEECLQRMRSKVGGDQVLEMVGESALLLGVDCPGPVTAHCQCQGHDPSMRLCQPIEIEGVWLVLAPHSTNLFSTRLKRCVMW